MSVRPVQEERVNGGGFAARGLTIGVLVAAALMALAALALVVLPRGGAGTRPVMVTVGQALDKLRAQLAAQQGAKVDQQAMAARAAALGAASARYAASVRALDGAWNALAPATSRTLAEGQRAWIAHKHEICRAAASRAAADTAQREADRLKCEAGANLARTRWVEAAARAGAMRAPVVSAGAACEVLRRRGWHLGETLTFAGEYTVDRRGGFALVRPLGCDQETGLSGAAPAARRQLDAAVPYWAPPHRRVVGRFTARLVLAPRDGARFFDDDGVRLQVDAVSGLQVIGAPAAHPRRPSRRR